MKVVLAFVSLFSLVFAINNGLGRLPPMGWNTWCTAGHCERDYCWDQEIREIADAMVENGMKDLGYQYVNLDDCWAATYRDSAGNLVAEPSRFPHGMKAVSDYVHSKGLKMGIYTDSGTEMCTGGRPGSYGHYQQDANQFAAWGIDYVKMDWCKTIINGTQLDPKIVYHNMSEALNKTGRPIFFNACEWGFHDPWLWAARDCNSWRSGQDHHDQWDGHPGTATIIEQNADLGKYAGPGGWNDLDFLMTGGEGCTSDYNKICPGQTWEEYRTEFSMWVIMSSPLIVATDIRPPAMTEKKKEILFNKEMIAVNQDPLGKAGGRVALFNCDAVNITCQIWAKDLQGGEKAVALYNRGQVSHNITVRWDQLGWPRHTTAIVRDLWQHKDLGHHEGLFTASVPSHGTVVIRIKQKAE
eukprot:TRINITY_DN2622_c0_g1_i1.p1 TRINITY_DN2622_c0_g1~~TRINITY_DN2622_c0_g1_i1.p1  ORF type:complete len:412 (-),score=92.41 TRINITY_DN2622_c0_g1_i1:141-1376(-)